MTTATSGVLARFPLFVPVRNSCASYGASAVARTPDRGHVAEVMLFKGVRNPVAGYGASAVTRTPDRGHVAEVEKPISWGGGVSIRVSKETFLPLNVQPVFSF